MPRRTTSVGSHRAGSETAVAVDASVPALLLKVGSYPVHHGSVGVARSLGRLGIPVFALTENLFTPTALSRYVRKAFVWPTTGSEDPEELVAGVLALAEQVGTRAVLVPTDDEAATLVAEHGAALKEHFFLPRVAPDLPRRLASKHGLATLCREFDVPTPNSTAPRSLAALFADAESIGFPLVVKNDEAWLRLTNPAVRSSTFLSTLAELEHLAAGWPTMPSVFLQEQIPPATAEDWIVHAYFGDDRDSVVVFTGIKLRSWPPQAGVTALAYSTPNPELAELAVGFAQAVGFRGIADMDWRLDTRDGRYKLLDFNPRIGAQFRAFETDQGVDVVRALHLDLTGRSMRCGRQIDSRRYVVEHLAGPAALSSRRNGRLDTGPRFSASGGVERAWIALDDPLPAAMTALRVAASAPWLIARMLKQRRITRHARSRGRSSTEPSQASERTRDDYLTIREFRGDEFPRPRPEIPPTAPAPLRNSTNVREQSAVAVREGAASRSRGGGNP